MAEMEISRFRVELARVTSEGEAKLLVAEIEVLPLGADLETVRLSLEDRLRVSDKELEWLGSALGASRKVLATIKESTMRKRLMDAPRQLKTAETLLAAERENVTLRELVLQGVMIDVVDDAASTLSKCLDAQLESFNQCIVQCFRWALTAV